MSPATISKTDPRHIATLDLYAVEYVEWIVDTTVTPPSKQEVRRFGAIVSASGLYGSLFFADMGEASAKLDTLNGELLTDRRDALDDWIASCKLTRAAWLVARHLRSPARVEANATGGTAPKGRRERRSREFRAREAASDARFRR